MKDLIGNYTKNAERSAKRLMAHMVFVDDEHQERVESFIRDCVLMVNVKGIEDNNLIERGLEAVLWDVVKALKPFYARRPVTCTLVVPEK